MAYNFLDDEQCTTFTKGIYFFLFGLMGMASVGVNRLSIIPCICVFTNTISCPIGWWVYIRGNITPAGVFWMYVWFCSNDFFIVFYGYYLLEKLLPPVSGDGLLSRKAFSFVFWPLQITNGMLRLGMIICATVAQAKTGNESTFALYLLAQLSFLTTTIIEISTAYLLIIIFRRSRKTAIRFLGGKRLGLFRHMLLSTELRVASISLAMLIRASCESPKRHSLTAGRIDNIAIDMLNVYPVLLTADCILRRSIGLEIELQNRSEKCGCIGGAEKRSPVLDLGTLQSVAAPEMSEERETTQRLPSHKGGFLDRVDSASA